MTTLRNGKIATEVTVTVVAEPIDPASTDTTMVPGRLVTELRALLIGQQIKRLTNDTYIIVDVRVQ